MKSNVDALNQLYKILNDEIAILEKILKVERNKHNKIMKGKLIDLTPFNDSTSKLSSELDKIEIKRLAGLMRVASTLEIGEKKPSLMMIIDRLEPPEKNDFLKIYDQLSFIAKDIKKLNRLNGELIKDQLGLIQCTLSACIGDGSLETNYGDEKDKSQKSNAIIFDTKI